MKWDEIKKIAERISKLDCGDSSCLFAKNKGGMRTNGGCRCLNGRPNYGFHILSNNFDKIAAVVDSAKDYFENNSLRTFTSLQKALENLT